MDPEKIRDLLQKYWNCETSIEEENILRKYFIKEDVPADLTRFRPLFFYYNEKSAERLTDDFERRLFEKIDKKPEKTRHQYINLIYKAAAAIILILSFYVIHQRFINVQDQARRVVEDTFEDPRKALEETKKALFFVSEKLNKGKAEVTKISKFSEAEEIIRNTKYEEI